MVMQRSGQLPKIPKEYVQPQIVAGVNALGRGQDRESLTAFIGTIAQTLGPEALMKYIDASEAIKRLAAAQGIDVLNLVKTPQQMQQEMQQQQAMASQQQILGQAGQMMSAPLMDPSKNPDAAEMAQQLTQQQPPADG